MFGMHPHKKTVPRNTLEARIRDACGPIAMGASYLIVLQLDEEHERKALVLHNDHGYITVLLEPDAKTYIAECFIVEGDELRDDPHGMSVWPGHDEHFMAQFHRKPHAVVSWYAEEVQP